jgi:hypothetical protein
MQKGTTDEHRWTQILRAELRCCFGSMSGERMLATEKRGSE